MDREALQRRLQATFLEELAEYVDTLDSGLLAIEKRPAETAERLPVLLRAAHSLKGAARAIDAAAVERACHRIEEVLASARDRRSSLAPETITLVLSIVDAIREAAVHLAAGGRTEEGSLPELLHRAEGALSAELAERPSAPLPSTPVAATAARAETFAGRGQDAATVRIPAAKLDSLLTRSGELIVARHRVTWRPPAVVAMRERLRGFRDLSAAELQERVAALDEDLERLGRGLAADARLLEHAARALDEEVRRVRMLPFAEACRGLDRTARDIARATGKEVDLEVRGGEVELDRTIIEQLRDPLLHVVRNAVDHGIESPGARRAAGKPAVGTIRITAALHGAEVEIVVVDDGGGIDLEALRAELRRREAKDPEDDRELARLVFLPGLSTARRVTHLSGRGIGLDVVKSRVESLHGTVDVSTQAGSGTRLTLKMPLTLTILRALLVKAAGQTFAFASGNVHRLCSRDRAEISRADDGERLVLGGRPVPLFSVAAALGAPQASARSREAWLVVIDAPGEQRVAFAVEELRAEQDVLVKGLGRRIRNAGSFSGATILPSGEIVLLFNAGALVRRALQCGAAFPAPVERLPRRPRRLVLADDSVTSRSLEKAILEGAGYEVAAFADGEAAWQGLQEHGADAVVSDVEMPRLDGFALTARIRASERFRDLPVVLVSARESDEDKARGLEAGANAYLVKSTFDRASLLSTLGALV